MKANQYTPRVHKFIVVALTVSTGLATTQAQVAEYPGFPVSGPTDQFPANFSSFNPPIDTNMTVHADATKIAEWTRSNEPGDTMALTGEALSSFTKEGEEGRDTHFIFYGEGWPETDGLIQRLDGRQCAITLPESLPSNEMYLMWPHNDKGFGEPVVINQTEAWWVGFDEVSVGDKFYVYGRNLVLGDNDSYLFWSNNTTAATGWMTNTVRNPFRNEYVVPANFSNTDYTLWAHNGSGRKYGWADSLDLTVVDKWLYDAGTKDMVSDFGANGSDMNDDQAAFDACETYVDANPGTIVTIPAGTYYLSGLFDARSYTRYVGAGTNQTFITATETGRVVDSGLFQGRDHFELKDLTIDLTDSVDCHIAIKFSGSDDGYVDDVVFSQSNVTDRTLHAFMDLAHAKRLHMKNCTFIQGESFGFGQSNYVRMEDCKFRGVYDCNQMVTLDGPWCVDLTGCIVSGLDQSDASEGFGWSKGRWIVERESRDVYVSGNETQNLHPRIPTPFMPVTSVTAVSDWVDEGGGIGEQTVTLSSLEDPGDNHLPAWITMDPPNFWYANKHRIREINAANNTIRLEVADWNIIEYTDNMTAFATDHVDLNSGEQYLVEGPVTFFNGSPVSVTETTMVFDPGETLVAKATYKFQFVSIVGGKGLGQIRQIESVVSSNATMAVVTLIEPWRVAPDTQSKVNMGRLPTHHAIYNNVFDGIPDVDTTVTASAGIALWGSSGDIDIVNNTFSELRRAIPISPYGNSWIESGVSTMGQSMFNLIRSNRFENCHTDIARVDNNRYGPPTDVDVTFLGNVYRGNYSTNASYAFLQSELEANIGDQGRLSVWQDNTVVDAATVVVDSMNLINQVWIDNTLHSRNNNIGWSIASGNTVALRGNTWTGVSASYAGTLPGGVLEIPVRVINLGGSVTTTGQVPIWNSGTSPMDWSASTTNSWLELTKTSGSVSGENDEDTLSFKMTPGSEPVDGSQAIIAVTSGGQTKQITVYYSASWSEDGTGAVLIDLSGFEPGSRVRGTLEDLGTPEEPKSGEFRDLGELDITKELVVTDLADHAYRFVVEVYNDASATWVTNTIFVVNRQR